MFSQNWPTGLGIPQPSHAGRNKQPLPYHAGSDNPRFYSSTQTSAIETICVAPERQEPYIVRSCPGCEASGSIGSITGIGTLQPDQSDNCDTLAKIARFTRVLVDPCGITRIVQPRTFPREISCPAPGLVDPVRAQDYLTWSSCSRSC